MNTLALGIRAVMVSVNLLAAGLAQSVCGSTFLPGESNGADGEIFAMCSWDPDGNGPLPSRLVCGGRFQTVGPVRSPYIAAFDPSTRSWHPLGGGLNDVVYALTVTPTGDLLAAGNFWLADGIPSRALALYGANGWRQFAPTGPNGVVSCVAYGPNGDLYAGGNFTLAGGVPSPMLTRWDGQSWHDLGAGLSVPVRAICFYGGELYIGGSFTSVAGQAIRMLAKYDGVTWSAVGGGLEGQYVTSLVPLASGGLAVGGELSRAGGVSVSKVAVWDGASWSARGTSAAGDIYFAADGNGELVGLGDRVRLWNGTSWTQIAPGMQGTHRVAQALQGSLFTGGNFLTVAGVSARHVAEWNGTSWRSTVAGSPLNGRVTRVQAAPGGEVAVSGDFLAAGDTALPGAALWTGSGWRSFPMPANAPNRLRIGGRLANGDLVLVASSFIAQSFYRWDGVTATLIATHENSVILNDLDVVSLPNGDLIANYTGPHAITGPFTLRRWDGQVWSDFSPGINGGVESLKVLADGSLLVAGSFTQIGGLPMSGIARWDQGVWSAFGARSQMPLLGLVRQFLEAEGGHLYAFGDRQTVVANLANSVYRWNGSGWQALPGQFAGNLSAGVVLPGGKMLFGGGIQSIDLTAATSCENLLLWDGANWLPVPLGTSGVIDAMLMQPDGSILVGGRFERAGNHAAGNFAIYAPDCPAQAVDLGGACPGASSQLSLTAEVLPWLGATARSKVTGIPAQGLAVAVLGLGAADQPLTVIHPAGQPGCRLRTSVDASLVLSAVQGDAMLQFAVPNVPSLLGVALRQQALLADLDPALQLIALSSSSAVELRVGSF